MDKNGHLYSHEGGENTMTCKLYKCLYVPVGVAHVNVITFTLQNWWNTIQLLAVPTLKMCIHTTAVHRRCWLNFLQTSPSNWQKLYNIYLYVYELTNSAEKQLNGNLA